MEPRPRIGVYICHCGTNVAATVDVEAVTEFAATLPGVVVARHYTYMCSEPGQALIREDARALGLNRVVVASCSPRMHEPTFRAASQEGGVNPYQFEMANIREQCSWVHHDRHEATEKAKALVYAAVMKAIRLEPLEEREAPVTPAALVIGGGVAGMMAALDIAEAGFPVYLVEKSDHLGGRVAELNRTFPDLEPVSEWLPALVDQVQRHPNITVYLNSRVTNITGFVGNFEATVEGAKEPLKVGAIVIATGYDVFDPRRKPEFGYGIYPQVVTTLELEHRLAAGDLTVNGKTPKDVVFVKCVGSRDQQLGRPYCSRVCCMISAKQAQLVRQVLPDARVTVFYMDVRTFGKRGEEFYDEARRAGVRYRRGNVSEIYRRGDRVVVRVEDTLLGRTIEHEADLVVLAVGMEPRPEAADIAALLKLPRSADGFF
ncbi:MAG: CoB--CoM heterodisulfide reductase iron-sulfur subunit A family protein, partial [Anaerolineae bacterium]|nr:CoB--CoM heterodisulfide reductase iron-sulfur subunit A family protein [Anaerolineae bacterium]